MNPKEMNRLDHHESWEFGDDPAPLRVQLIAGAMIVMLIASLVLSIWLGSGAPLP